MRSIEKASLEIAKIRKAAKAGDPSAQKKIIALQFLTDKEMLLARANLKGKAAGVSDKVLKKASEDAIFHALKGWEMVVKRSAELEKTLPKPQVPSSIVRKMPDLKKTRGIIRNGAKILRARTEKAEKKRIGKGINGIFVSRIGEKIKGNFENVLTDKSVKAARGWVVLANGRTVSGRFRAIRA